MCAVHAAESAAGQRTGSSDGGGTGASVVDRGAAEGGAVGRGLVVDGVLARGGSAVPAQPASRTAGRRRARRTCRHGGALRDAAPVRLLFVCLGNICRSPTAEAVMARLVREAGLEGEVVVGSAGTSDFHIGRSPDPRSTAAAAARGTTLAGAARQVTAADFAEWDLLLCADRNNAAELLALAPDAAAAEKVRLLREFDPASVVAGHLDVPDPYFGDDGFEEVLDVTEAACAGLMEHLQRRGDRARR